MFFYLCRKCLSLLRLNHLTLMYKQNFGTMDVEVWTYIVSISVTEPSWITPLLKYTIDFACIQIPMYINSFPLDPCFGSLSVRLVFHIP